MRPPAELPDAIPERLFRGLSVYQDVVMAGQTVRRGERDCQARWQAIAPHVAQAGTVLDIGSNFGWFGLQICRANPAAVVASVEADLRSAAVQRAVLASHIAEQTTQADPPATVGAGSRICLLTARAGLRLAETFAAADTRFDAVLCLNVLHWLREHRLFLRRLGTVAAKIVIEHPDPDEAGAGVELVRREIGPIGPYLHEVFPGRPVERIAFTESHRDLARPRELWLVGPPADWPAGPRAGIDTAALLRLSLCWPPRSWWLQAADAMPQTATANMARQGVLFTARGLAPAAEGSATREISQIRRLAKRVPETGVASWSTRIGVHVRRLAGNALRRLGLRPV
ncbi:MAG: class I SAM-dependent methyltransferase [Pirellulales bacterium]